MLSKSIKICFSKFFNIEGRASRSEFWYLAFWMTFLLVSEIIFQADFNIYHASISIFLFWICVLTNIVFLIPFITCACRRLHDTGKSAAGIFLCIIPVVGWIIVLVMLAKESDGPNNYGKAEVF